MDDKVKKFFERFGRLPTEVDPDYLEMIRMSKYQISDVPMFKPGKCANCGASKNDGRRYVDFGLEVDWYGTVFLCGDCLTDVANAMGLFDKFKEAIEEVKANSFSLDVLREQGFAVQYNLEKTIGEVKEYFANLHSLGDDSSSDSNSSVVATETTTESAIDEAKPRVTKSSTVSGRENLPSLADLLNGSAGN